MLRSRSRRPLAANPARIGRPSTLRRTARLGGALALLALILPGSASGRWVDPDPRIQHLRPLAEAHFPAAQRRCHSGIVIREGSLRWESSGAEAWPPSRTGLAGYCEVRLRESWRSWPRSVLCVVLVHEWGHLAGLGHSDDPDDPMFGSAGVHSVADCGQLDRIERQLERAKGRLARARSRLQRIRSRARSASSVVRLTALEARTSRQRAGVNAVRNRIAALRMQLGP